MNAMVLPSGDHASPFRSPTFALRVLATAPVFASTMTSVALSTMALCVSSGAATVAISFLSGDQAISTTCRWAS